MSDMLIVQKYGGTSLCTPERIRRVAEKIAKRAGHDTKIVVTVSAMGQSTDELLGLAHEITPTPPQRELDMLLTVGERISMALLSMALNTAGCPAISFTGSQSGIVTNVSHTRATIEEIRASRIETELDRGKVVIVAGFQGVSREREITTLGRGGSDTTAVAIAAALDASQCEIYSDYPGVYTADPRWLPIATPIPRISYDEMLELAALGAHVLHYRAAEIARRYRVPLRLLSSFDDEPGTLVSEDGPVEQAKPTSITCNPNVSLIRIAMPGGAAIESAVGDLSGSDLQIIGYSRASSNDQTVVTLVVGSDDLRDFERHLGAGGGTVETRTNLGAVSVVGSGFACNAGAILGVEQLLSAGGIAVMFTSVSSLSITAVVSADDCRRAVDTLHAALFAKAGA